MPAHHAKSRPLVVANARHSPSYGCALHPRSDAFGRAARARPKTLTLWDPLADRWEAHTPMLTPRHGMGAVVLGGAIYVAGGGPQMGGGVKSAINEAFSPT